MQVQPRSLHAGVDLALEKNVVVLINEKARRLEWLDRGLDGWHRDVGGCGEKIGCAQKILDVYWAIDKGGVGRIREQPKLFLNVKIDYYRALPPILIWIATRF